MQEEKEQSSIIRRYGNEILLLFILLITFFIRLKFSLMPFERDEGVYFYFGQLILDGQKPYVDFFEMKPPLLYYSYAALIYLFGATVKGAHLAFTFINLFSIFFIYIIGKNILGKPWGTIAAAAFSLLSLTPHMSGFTTQSEHLVVFYFLAGWTFLSYALRSAKTWQFLLSGIFFGLAFGVKQSIVFPVFGTGLGLVLYYFIQDKKNWKHYILRPLLLVTGFLFVYGFFLILMKTLGVFDEFWYFTNIYPRRYASQIPWEQGKQLLSFVFKENTRNFYLLWIFSGIGLIGSLFSKKLSWSIKSLLFSFGFFSIFTIVPGFRFYGHYWLQLLPALSIFCAVGVFVLYELLQKFITEKLAKFIAFGIFLLSFFISFSKEKNYLLSPDYTKILRRVYGTNPFPETWQIAQYIKSRTHPEDKIVALGSEPEIYFYTNRRCVSRIAYTSKVVNGSERHREWQKELIKDIEEQMPKYIIFYNHPVCWLTQPDADKTIFQWFNKFSSQHYKLVGIADMIDAFNTRYVWDSKVINYQPKGKYYILIYERKNTASNRKDS